MLQIIIVLLFSTPTYYGTLPTVEVVYSYKQQSINLIKEFEGLVLEAYPDGLGYSICYGMRSYRGQTMTKAECEDRFLSFHNKVWNTLDKYPIQGSRKVALSSFYWNVTPGPRMNKKLLQGIIDPELWLQYNKVNGEFNQSIYNRRKKELCVFQNIP